MTNRIHRYNSHIGDLHVRRKNGFYLAQQYQYLYELTVKRFLYGLSYWQKCSITTVSQESSTVHLYPFRLHRYACIGIWYHIMIYSLYHSVHWELYFSRLKLACLLWLIPSSYQLYYQRISSWPRHTTKPLIPLISAWNKISLGISLPRVIRNWAVCLGKYY